MAAKPATTARRRLPRQAAPEPTPAAFEATCPRCGTTAEVPAGVATLRCPTCGQVAEMVDGAPGQAKPVKEAPAEADRTSLALAVGLLGPVLVASAFVTAHSAIDQPEPDTGTGGLWFLITLLLVAMVVFLQFRLLRPHAGRAAWGLFATVPAFAIAMIAGTGYDDGGLGLGGVLATVALVAYLVVVGIVALAAGDEGRGKSVTAVLVGGAGICAGIGLAALFLLMTLQEQAEEAREAYESPTLQAVAVLVVLLATAAWRRRR